MSRETEITVYKIRSNNMAKIRQGGQSNLFGFLLQRARQSSNHQSRTPPMTGTYICCVSNVWGSRKPCALKRIKSMMMLLFSVVFSLLCEHANPSRLLIMHLPIITSRLWGATKRKNVSSAKSARVRIARTDARPPTVNRQARTPVTYMYSTITNELSFLIIIYYIYK